MNECVLTSHILVAVYNYRIIISCRWALGKWNPITSCSTNSLFLDQQALHALAGLLYMQAYYPIIPYSGKFSLGANFRDFRGRTCFRENKNREKISNDDVITCIRRVPM